MIIQYERLIVMDRLYKHLCRNIKQHQKWDKMTCP